MTVWPFQVSGVLAIRAVDPPRQLQRQVDAGRDPGPRYIFPVDDHAVADRRGAVSREPGQR